MLIGKDVKIERLDRYCLGLFALTDIVDKKTGKTEQDWKLFGYYGTVQSALQGVLKYKLCTAMESILTIGQLKNYIKKVEDEILEAVKTQNTKL